jgi:hypothetical protein
VSRRLSGEAFVHLSNCAKMRHHFWCLQSKSRSFDCAPSGRSAQEDKFVGAPVILTGNEQARPYPDIGDASAQFSLSLIIAFSAT